VIVMENCKPILGEKIRYHREKVFKARLLPPPAVPAMDMDLHFARVQQRWHEVEGELPAGKSLNLEALAHDLTGLPDLNVGPVENIAETLLNFFAPTVASGGAMDAVPDDDGVLADAPASAAPAEYDLERVTGP
jgi:type IV secretion system protein VirD4